MKLLKELESTQVKLKNSDGSDAGKNDVANKATNDVAFSMMRNTINSDGEITGSDVADYIERAAELNDEVDTVPFGLETSDGEIVKVYVNAEQADKFEEALRKMLGMEDDIEEAVNRLAVDFDIVDVVWPKNRTDTDVKVQPPGDDEFDALDDDDDDADDLETIAEFDELDEGQVVEDIDVEAAHRKLVDVVGQLEALGIPGLSVVTGIDPANLTKREMIARFVAEKFSAERSAVLAWIKNSGATTEVPFWLQETR